jgi:hypothetical protein
MALSSVLILKFFRYLYMNAGEGAAPLQRTKQAPRSIRAQ